jgi:hypothetical protein
MTRMEPDNWFHPRNPRHPCGLKFLLPSLWQDQWCSYEQVRSLFDIDFCARVRIRSPIHEYSGPVRGRESGVGTRPDTSDSEMA